MDTFDYMERKLIFNNKFQRKGAKSDTYVYKESYGYNTGNYANAKKSHNKKLKEIYGDKEPPRRKYRPASKCTDCGTAIGIHDVSYHWGYKNLHLCKECGNARNLEHLY